MEELSGKNKKFWSFVISLKKDAFGITSLRENGILKTDTKEKADICNRQFQSAFIREADSDPPSKGTSPLSSMGEITVDPKGVAKLLDGLNVLCIKRLAQMDSMPECSKSVVHRFHLS